MRRRPSARFLIFDAEGRMLLFRFAHKTGALAGTVFWATPGGGVEPGESLAEAALRELAEETGLRPSSLGDPVARREAVMTMPDGDLSRDGWTPLEVEVMTEHRWWSQGELAATTETVYPEKLAVMLGG